MDLNLTNLKDLEYICQIARDYFDQRIGTTEEIEWLQRITKYQQLFQAEIYRLEAEEWRLKAEASRRVREDLILPPERPADYRADPARTNLEAEEPKCEHRWITPEMSYTRCELCGALPIRQI